MSLNGNNNSMFKMVLKVTSLDCMHLKSASVPNSLYLLGQIACQFYENYHVNSMYCINSPKLKTLNETRLRNSNLIPKWIGTNHCITSKTMRIKRQHRKTNGHGPIKEKAAIKNSSVFPTLRDWFSHKIRHDVFECT